MSKNLPDLSVVTVVLNDKTGLEKTLSSIKRQNGLILELIIVDGGSTDGSAELALANSTVQIESKPDGGIYPAMIRGASNATGEFIIFCNAGDALFGNDYLSESINLLRRSGNNWGFGPIIEYTERGTFNWIPANHKASSHSIISRKSFVPFPSFIIRKEFYQVLGGITSKYKIAGDFELICKSAVRDAPAIFKNPVAIFSAGGISYIKANFAWREEIAIRRDILKISRCRLANEWLRYALRYSKWKIGKLLDYFQQTFNSNSSSWRDSRADKVPEEYKSYLPK